ncbi:putative sushi domain protein [Trichinella spiralis]|uniref:putative sushi domain protein n=1 Tax=Trichinella spiralis TaxID=6334 RepID=UPI0001EFB467|nr:putative sushi domain protein [Trichinella spiralis]
MRNEMSSSATVLWSHYPYKAERWVHLAVTYDGIMLRFFVGGALVATTDKQIGPLFSNIKSACKHLLLGGPMPGRFDEGHTMNFRGAVDELQLWSTFQEYDFIQKMATGDFAPKFVPSDLDAFFNTYQVLVHACGQTVCDHPDVVRSYSANWELRQSKVVRYKVADDVECKLLYFVVSYVINIVDNSTGKGIVSDRKIELQHGSLSGAFAKYNITWQMEIVKIANANLRKKKIIFGCDSSKIGNKQCDLECRHPITGNDGGDCDELMLVRCQRRMLGNGRCDPECNFPEYSWDQGECCNKTLTDVTTNCIDPQSPFRPYIGIEEYKRMLNVSNEDALTISFVEWSNGDLIGLSTFPWEKHVFSIYGDLCEDTNPTPKNVECKDPEYAWLPPLSWHQCKPAVERCQHCECDTDGRFIQYASRVIANHTARTTSYWSPDQALGPPDAEPCEASTKSWLPDAQNCDNNNACSLVLGFEVAVVPAHLKLWISWNAADGLKHFILHFDDSSMIALPPATAFCDMPYTLSLDTDKRLTKVELTTSSPFVSIDAVQIVSNPNHELCSKCSHIDYNIVREPPFPKPPLVQSTADTFFTDRDLKQDQVYMYRIGARRTNSNGAVYFSPPLIYSHSRSFCGDGNLDESTENCDDGNMYDEDGCSSDYMPDVSYASEHSDQWAARAFSNAEPINLRCNTTMILGPPRNLVCQVNSPPGLSWQPCLPSVMKNVWIEVEFEQPVVATAVFVHLASDGYAGVDSEYRFLRLELVSVDNKYYELQNSKLVTVSCAKSPLEYPVWHDLTKPFFYSRAVRIHLSSERISIAAVRLRSKRNFDPVVLELCSKSDMLYSVFANQCVSSQCSVVSCKSVIVNHADVQCTGHSNGDSCIVTCMKGYHLVKHERAQTHAFSYSSQRSAKIICLNGQWSVGNLKCEPVDCGWPKIFRAEVLCPDGTRLGAKCSFRCLRPAIMQGTKREITCGERGAWSVPEAYCQLSCGPSLEGELNGRAVSKLCRINFLTLDLKSVGYPVGTKCRIVCKAGYHVEGHSINNQIRDSVCMMDGTWSIADPCVLPKDVTCSIPHAPGHIVVSCPSKRLVGSTCHVACDAQGYDPVVEHVVNSDRNFKMHVLQKITKLTCSIKRKWEPEVESVICVKRCTQDFVGDGWCDFQNNRAYCGWDGGDCCASTAKGGKVKLMFPLLCTSHLCRCLDPYAVENRNPRIIPRAFLVHGYHGSETLDKEEEEDLHENNSTEHFQSPDLMMLMNNDKNRTNPSWKPLGLGSRVKFAWETSGGGSSTAKLDHLSSSMLVLFLQALKNVSSDPRDPFLLLQNSATTNATIKRLKELDAITRFLKRPTASTAQPLTWTARWFRRRVVHPQLSTSILKALRKQHESLQVKS